jgi:hypothetical protein
MQTEVAPEASTPSAGKTRGEQSFPQYANGTLSPQARIAWIWVLITHVCGDVRPGRLLHLTQGKVAQPHAPCATILFVGFVWRATLAKQVSCSLIEQSETGPRNQNVRLSES